MEGTKNGNHTAALKGFPSAFCLPLITNQGKDGQRACRIDQTPNVGFRSFAFTLYRRINGNSYLIAIRPTKANPLVASLPTAVAALGRYADWRGMLPSRTVTPHSVCVLLPVTAGFDAPKSTSLDSSALAPTREERTTERSSPHRP